MKKFRWTVEIEIDETWVADGFDLTDERAHNIMCAALGHARSTEIRCRVTRRPPLVDINIVQGASHDVPRTDWPRPTSSDNPRFIVTGIDVARGRTIYGVLLSPNNGELSELSLGNEPDEYQIEIGDIVEYRSPKQRTVYCVDFDSDWSKYPEYDTRARRE